jgi:hypothetical protein
MFRPCIDLHEGKVKQIVGGTLGESGLKTNFVSDRGAAWYADLYRRDDLRGGHVIMLGAGNEEAARKALGAFPGGSMPEPRTSSSRAGCFVRVTSIRRVWPSSFPMSANPGSCST